jgi:ADP-ribose pyrophosphatase YjhB (NUDIX family)
MAKKQIPFNPGDNPVRKQSLELAKKADKTLGYNREVVEKTGLGQEAVYTGLQAYYAPKAADFFDPYEDYVDKNTLRGGEFNVDELNKIRASNQSNWQQAGHAVARVATNIVPQIVSGFASMVDIPGYFSAEEAANNEIVNWAQDLKKTVDEDWFPIYEEEPKSMNISDPAWWMSRGSGLVESIGSFAATGLGAGKLISGGLKGLGTITRGKDLTRAIIGAEKSKNLLTGASTVTNAVAMNQAESVISATQVFKDTYEEKLAQGWKRDKAKQAASEAAATTMQLNKINILFNLTSARAFVSPLKSSREILKKATGLGKVGHVVMEGGQEAAEELVNLVAEKAGTAKGKQESYTLNDALKDINTMEGFEAAFLGALGGMGQTGITSASEYSKYGAGNTKDAAGNRISKVAYENNRYAEQQEVMDSLKAKGVKVTDIMQNFKDNVLFQEKLEKAREKGDIAEIQKLQEDMLESQAIKAFQSGTTEVLENLYKEEAAQDPEVVGQEHIARANDAIAQIKELEAIYNNFEDYGNVDEIFFNRANKNRAIRNAKYVEQLKKQADFELNKDLHSIADKYSYDRERDILIKEDGKVVRTDKVMEKVPLSYASSDLETNQGKTEAEQKVYDKFLNEVKALESYKNATSYAEQLSEVEKVIRENDAEFSNITSKKYQEKVVAKKAKEAAIKEGYEVVKQSTSIAEIEKLKTILEDPTFDKVADAKIADLQKSNDIAAKQKQVAVVIEKFQQRIKNATQEELNAITAEVDAAELSQKNKTTLTLDIQKRSDIINGVTTAEEDVDEDNPLFKYNSKDPAELEAEAEQEKESFDTEIPTDLPNPETEKTDVEGAVADAAEKLAKEDKTLIIGEDAQGNLVYGYSRSAEGYNRAAFLSREMNQTETTGRIDREEFTDKLEDNLDLLNPDFLIAGTPLNMQVDTEYEGDKYDPTSNTRQKTPWVLRLEALQKQADAQGIPLTSLPEYIAEVPIKVTNDVGDIVFYVHDNAWYRAENLSATTEEIAEDRAKNFKIREAIIKKGTPVKTKVSYKSFGKLFKSSTGEPISVSEAMPDPNLILAVGRNGAIEFSGDVSKILKGGTLLKTNIEDGRAYAIVKVGPKEYLPIPLEKTPLSPEVVNSIMFAVEAYLTGDVNNPIVKAIAKSPLSVDITTFSGLAEYLGQFIYLFPTKGTKGLDNYLIRGGINTNLKSNRPLISINPTGLEFGRPGVNMGSYTKPDGTTVVKPSIKLSPNFKSKAGVATNAAGLIKLRALLESGNILSNVDRKVLAKNIDSTLILDEEGNTTSQKYSDQIKQSHKTNILSVNVGTEEDPIWAYTIQPTILFDTAFAGIDSTKKAKAATPKLKVTPAQKSSLNYKGVNPTVDLIVTKVVNGIPQVLVIKRSASAEAAPNKLAFPGGFHDTNAKKGNKWKAGKETAEEAALRELKEETGLDLTKSSMNIQLEKVGVFDAQDRDSRNSNTSWVSSTVFRINLPENFDISTEVSGKDDAQEARWVPVSELSATDKSEFGFDHADILESEGLVYFKETTPNTKKTITRKYVTLETSITAFGPEEQALLNNPTPTIEEYEAVVQKLEKLIKIAEQPANKILFETALRDIKNSFEISDKQPAAGIQSDIEAPASNQTIETLRAEEQLELAKAIPNIANYPDTYGEKQGNMPDDLYAIYKPIYDEYNKKITALSPTQPTPEQEVETLTGDALIEAYAQDIVGSGYPLSSIEGILENLDLGAMPLQAVIDMGFTSLEEAKESFAKAKEIFIANSKESKTITLPNGLTIKVDKNTKDTTSISDDATDELISEMTEEQLEAQRKEIDEMIIRGIDSATQSSLISYLSSDIITQALAAKEVDGKKKVKAGAILDKHLIALKELSRFYKDQDLPNKAARLDAIVAQFDKVKRLVNQNMSKFSTGTVDETLELNDGEADAGLVRTSYSDNWTFTLSSKITASADLKKFFSIVRAQDENGPVSNILGLPEILPYDTVDNTLKEILSNKPADYALLVDILELNVEKFPWIKSVIDQLEAAPEKIKNEFVSDMTKHHVDMQFAMWSKDYNGNYSLQKWSSNSSSIEQRLRSIWNSNLKGVATRSNLVVVNEEDEYVFNTEVGNALVAQAKEWAKNPNDVTNEELANWLGNFGIVLSDGTYDDLRNGKFNNKGRKSWGALFTNSAGLVKVLATALNENIQGEISLKDANIINDSAVKALAKLEAANSYNTYSNSFQAGGKTIYSYGNNNFLVNRMRDLTAFDEETGTFVNQDLIEGLSKISFTKDSAWLGDLTNADKTGQLMRNTFAVKYLSLEALKKAFTRSQDNKKLNNLTTAEHEVTKIAFFQNNSGEIVNGEQRRMVDFFYPTMSDKTTMLTISSLSREITLTDGEISDESVALLYKTLVLPEINRIRDNQTTNIKGYEPNYFYFLNTLNTLPVTTGNDADGNPIQKSFLDIVKDKNDLLNSPEVKDAVNAEIKAVFANLITAKVADWKQLGIGETIATPQGKVTDKFTFLDSEYMSKVVKAGKGTTPVRYAAMDYVFNYLIANAEIYKLFVGDPALYAKFNSKKTLEQNLKETFINLGKRLAGDIAPGIELADSANNKYYQVFLEDKEIASNNAKDTIQKEFFEKIVSTYADAKKGYGAIEGSDAQEYTTWKEHLYIMQQLGRLTQAQYDKFYKKLEAQSNGDFRKVNKLTYEELGIVMQPLKPVYVGNRLSVSDNVDSRVYIKSSSFPLLPQLTEGLQINKIRKGLETFEAEVGVKTTSDGVPAFVRASFGTANKVGAVKNSVKVFDDNGNVLDNFKVNEENSLLLNRSNFRIQQDVPYKREKDSVNIGTQERKLLFVNTLDLEIEPGVKGSDLMELYNKNYEELFTYAKENLEERLGLVESTPMKADISSLLSIPDSTLFEEVEKFQEELKELKPIAKVQKQQDFAEEMGDTTLERVNFINKNFDKIVQGLIGAKMNVFFDENNEFKKCE